MDTFIGFVVGIVVLWFILKYSFLALVMIWEEISPAVIFIAKSIGVILQLPFVPLVLLWAFLFGRKETEEEHAARIREEERQAGFALEEQEKQKQLEEIRRAVRID